MSGPRPGKKPAVSDAHVNEAAKLEAALSVSMNKAKSIVAGWITDVPDDDSAAAPKAGSKGQGNRASPSDILVGV